MQDHTFGQKSDKQPPQTDCRQEIKSDKIWRKTTPICIVTLQARPYVKRSLIRKSTAKRYIQLVCSNLRPMGISLYQTRPTTRRFAAVKTFRMIQKKVIEPSIAKCTFAIHFVLTNMSLETFRRRSKTEQRVCNRQWPTPRDGRVYWFNRRKEYLSDSSRHLYILTDRNCLEII